MHTQNPAALIETAFRRIYAERMGDLPFVNPVLDVAAVGFSLVDGKEWRGVLLTPWSLGLMLLPATDAWEPITTHTLIYREFASGNFVFLGNVEEGLGEYLLCPLIHDMKQFADHETALLTARACLIALDMPPPQANPEPEPEICSGRRKFLAMGS